MRKLSLFFILLMVSVFCSVAKSNANAPGNQPVPEFSIEGAGKASGVAKVKITLTVKNKKDATDDLFKKAAVYGVLFRGYIDPSVQGHGEFSKHAPIASGPQAYTTHLDFFEPFFVSDYSGFVPNVSAEKSRVKTDKGYRVTAIVTVDTDGLKVYLQKQGMYTPLSAGW